MLLQEGEEGHKTMKRHGRKRNYWIDIVLVDLFVACTISILLLCSMLIDTDIDTVYPVHWEVVKTQDKDYNRHILTDSDLSRLYSCKPDYRLTNTQIIQLTYDEAQMLMEVSRAEGGPTLLGQLWTMRTIINRVQSNDFPDNVIDVVTEEGEFEVVWTGKYKDAEINVNTHIALAMIEQGWNMTEGALFFEASSNTENSWHAKNLTFIKEVEGNRYYK